MHAAAGTSILVHNGHGFFFREVPLDDAPKNPASWILMSFQRSFILIELQEHLFKRLVGNDLFRDTDLTEFTGNHNTYAVA
jgi:hypothetical protein